MDKIACSVNTLYERYPYPSLPIRNENDLTYKLHANIMSKILTTAGIDQSCLSGEEILDAGCDIMDFKTQKRFDHIFCLGVLHHTNDPYGRFLHRAKRAWILTQLKWLKNRTGFFIISGRKIE